MNVTGIVYFQTCWHGTLLVKLIQHLLYVHGIRIHCKFCFWISHRILLSSWIHWLFIRHSCIWPNTKSALIHKTGHNFDVSRQNVESKITTSPTLPKRNFITIKITQHYMIYFYYFCYIFIKGAWGSVVVKALRY